MLKIYNLLDCVAEMIGNKFIFEIDTSKLHQTVDHVPALVRDCSCAYFFVKQEITAAPALWLNVTRFAVRDTRGDYGKIVPVGNVCSGSWDIICQHDDDLVISENWEVKICFSMPFRFLISHVFPF